MSTATTLSMPPRRERRAEGAVAPHLLGHGENLEAETVGFGAHRPGIRFGCVEVDHVGVRRDLPGLMEGDRLFDQAWIAAADEVQEHLEPSVSGLFAQRQRDRGKDDQSAHHHLPGHAEPHQDEAVVEHAHEQRADQRADDRADRRR